MYYRPCNTEYAITVHGKTPLSWSANNCCKALCLQRHYFEDYDDGEFWCRFHLPACLTPYYTRLCKFVYGKVSKRSSWFNLVTVLFSLKYCRALTRHVSSVPVTFACLKFPLAPWSLTVEGPRTNQAKNSYGEIRHTTKLSRMWLRQETQEHRVHHMTWVDQLKTLVGRTLHEVIETAMEPAGLVRSGSEWYLRS